MKLIKYGTTSIRDIEYGDLLYFKVISESYEVFSRIKIKLMDGHIINLYLKDKDIVLESNGCYVAEINKKLEIIKVLYKIEKGNVIEI